MNFVLEISTVELIFHELCTAGVDEVMSREIMDNTADAFSMVAPLHQLEFELGDLKVSTGILSSFNLSRREIPR